MSTDRMLELLTEQTERPLSTAERSELSTLLERHPKWRADDFELAAAATAMAFLGTTEPLPETVKIRVMAELSGEMFAGDTVSMPAQKPLPRFEPKPAPPPTPSAKVIRPSRWTQYGGWLAAAAAVILLALMLWPKPKPIPESVDQVRARLLADASSVRAKWTQTEDPLSKAARGDVVFDEKTQRGYMRFTGLPKNDPTKNQYQLWIFDGTRDAAHPVDGGVFDISADGEVIVPIDPKIRVFNPTMFAVTLERPGGVVVSTRERLVVLAKVQDS